MGTSDLVMFWDEGYYLVPTDGFYGGSMKAIELEVFNGLQFGFEYINFQDGGYNSQCLVVEFLMIRVLFFFGPDTEKFLEEF